MDNTSKDPVLNAAQRFIDHYFGNPNTERPKITIPAKESNSDLALINGIKALRTELDEAKAGIERLRGEMEEAKEIERLACGHKAREYAENYPEASDGRNTFIIFAEQVESNNIGRSVAAVRQALKGQTND